MKEDTFFDLPPICPSLVACRFSQESTKTVTKEPKDEVKIEDLQVHEVDGSKEEERLIKDLKEDVQKTVTEEHLADQAASADGEVDRDVPKELCGLSQSSTQASEAVDERTVRPLPPRPMHAPEPQPDSPLEPLEWEMLPDKHPSEAKSLEQAEHFLQLY